jgi:menaquinone-specific isochorismate synthase
MPFGPLFLSGEGGRCHLENTSLSGCQNPAKGVNSAEMKPAQKVVEMAWLHSSSAKTAIEIECWAASPKAGALSFFAPDFALASAQPWLLGHATEAHLTPAVLPPLELRADPSSADFAKMHEEILTRIRHGEFAKVVPIVCEELEFSAPLHAAMFTEAMDAPENRFAYGFECAGEGMCGVTPEILFSVRDGVLQTMALAGTGPSDGPSLCEDPKEMREHALVIEHITGELRRWGEPSVGATVERRYGVLKHLYTPIEMHLRELPEFMDLVVSLHPTAALGGWPRLPAVEWLERQSFHTGRKRFGAPFGYLHGENMFCVVAIRCLQWWGARALLSAGCGVVEGSQSLREWKELQLKRRAICDSLGLSL